MTDRFEKTSPLVLMVDDDLEDVYLTKRAFISQLCNIDFRSVQNGQQFFNYLNREGEFAGLTAKDMPDVILLDINIPLENGFAILEKLRNDLNHGHLPVIMLTTSTSEKDIRTAYQLGASSFICKSVNSSEMKETVNNICQYWFGFAQLPSS
jgi:CheY-like chemotaxis protein